MSTGRTIDELEAERLKLQVQLDSQKTKQERNRLGQFATPTTLAQDMLTYAKKLLPAGERIRFIDPAIGTGAFYSALLKVFGSGHVEQALGFEIDPHYGEPAAQLWAGSNLTLKPGDFTKQEPFSRFNLLICNPPYVRHHHLTNGDKMSLQFRTLKASGAKISGLAGLYCHFLGLAHPWLEEGAVSGWLIPSEFMDVNYGQAVKRFLLERVTLLRIHRFDPDDVQFADALVSSAIVWFRNLAPPKDNTVTFTFGGTLAEPKLSKIVSAKALAQERKWTRFPEAKVRRQSDAPTIAEFFKIKRGLATGNNDYFILSAEELQEKGLPRECFKPILPSPRYIEGDEIEADKNGEPLIERRMFLLDPEYAEEEIKAKFPALWVYLETGKAQGIHERYLCRHRSVWYAQENRPPAPIVCTYLGRNDTKRGRPFRFILNHSRATVANVYLAMYPTPRLAIALARDPGLIRRVWQVLNRITPAQLLGEGRVYGGGLHKLEPKELANVPVSELVGLLPQEYRPAKQMEIFQEVAAK